MKKNLIRVLMLSLAMLAVTSPVRAIPADEPPDWVPFGAYLSWERPYSCAAAYKIDHWKDVTTRLDALVKNHVDTLWVVNLIEADLPRLIAECEQRNLRLLAGMGSLEARVPDRWADNGKYYDTVIPALLKMAGNSKALAGWVLSDEPSEKVLPNVEKLRQRFRKVDPDRFCLVVGMWPQIPVMPKLTTSPVFCTDLYPFFGPNDPNGPHTDPMSQAFYRNNSKALLDAIGTKNAVAWIMGMCFSEIGGPRKYNANGHLIALPGAYLHWRCPTLAEMRWQVWEALRSGAKGVFIYTLAPESPNPQTAKEKSPDAPWKNVFVKTPTDGGPNALTNPDGSATPQLEELGRVFKALGPHRPLIRRWKPTAGMPGEKAAMPNVAWFTDPQTGNGYCMMVNDNLHQEKSVRAPWRPSDRAINLITNQTLRPDGNVLKVNLPAGSGAIVKIIPPPRP